MGILGNLFGMDDERSSDIGARIALAGQALMAMDQGQVPNIAPSIAALNERRRKIADEMKTTKWMQNQAAAMADKNPRLAQMLQDPNLPPEIGSGLISKYIATLPEFQLPEWKTFESNGDIMRYPADMSAPPELYFDGPGKAEPRYRPATLDEKRQFGVTPETPLAIEEGTNKPVVISGNGVTINNGSKYGTIPAGYQLVETAEGAKLVPIPGGPAEAEQSAAATKAANASGNKQMTADVVTQDIDRALEIIDNNAWYDPAAGAGASVAAKVGGSSAANLKALTNTIAGSISFDTLQRMREASPTGGALGAVSGPELDMLRSALGSVEQSQSEDQLRYNLNRLWNIYQDTIHGPNAGPPRRPLKTPGGQTFAGFDPDDVALLQRDPSPEAKAEFDQAYGPGASDRVLKGGN